MADLSIPAGAVTCRDGDRIETLKATVAITGGQGLYKSGSKFDLADADTEATANLEGVAVCDAAIDEYVTCAKDGAVITVASSTFTPGQMYVVSTTAGGFAPFSDLGSGDYVTYGLVGLTATTARVIRIVTGIAIA